MFLKYFKDKYYDRILSTMFYWNINIYLNKIFLTGQWNLFLK